MISPRQAALLLLLHQQAINVAAIPTPQDATLGAAPVNNAITTIQNATVNVASVNNAIPTPQNATVNNAVQTPQDTTLDVAPVNNAIQANNGGRNADNCGGGSINLDADTWKAKGVDQVIADMFSARGGVADFDFHQEFADKYSIDFFCPNSFSNCESEPSSCSDLTGSTLEKEQGWLGIKAMMNAQRMFLNYEKVATNTFDGVSGFAVEFQTRFAPDQVGKALGRKFGGNAIAGLLTGIVAFASIAFPVLTPVAITVGIGAPLIATSVNDNQDDKEANGIDATNISDRIPELKQTTLSGFEFWHNATFSNGTAGSVTGVTMQQLLVGGAFAGSDVLTAYDQGENGLQEFYDRYVAIKLLEDTWRNGQNAFMVYIPGVDDKSCQGWHGNTGDDDVRRFCGASGMTIIAGVNDNGDNFKAPQGVSNENVNWIGNYNIQLPFLYESAYRMYLDHGLVSEQDIGFHFQNLLNKYVAENNHDDAFKSPGFFNMPVCQIGLENFRQSDNMHKEAPCDCLCSQDPFGHKFMDVASEPVKKWIQSNTKCTQQC